MGNSFKSMENFHGNGLKGHKKIAQGVARNKSLALPWATLLRPLRGLDVIFIDRVDLVMAHSYGSPLS